MRAVLVECWVTMNSFVAPGIHNFHPNANNLAMMGQSFSCPIFLHSKPA
jgi:hypothetical protein